MLVKTFRYTHKPIDERKKTETIDEQTLALNKYLPPQKKKKEKQKEKKRILYPLIINNKMTDRFGRQKSTRWVNSVPTYGDWGDDDYEDEYTYQEDNSSQQQRKVTPQRFELPSDHVPPVPVIDEKYKNFTAENNIESNVSQPKELVLSVDGQTNLESDSSDEESEIISQGCVSPYKQANKQTFGISQNFDEKSTTPGYSVNTPVIVSNNGSDSNVERNDNNEEDNKNFTRALKEIQSKESHHEDLEKLELQHRQKDESESDKQVSESSSTKKQPNLILSVDKHKNIYSDSSDDDDNDDDMGSSLNFGASTHSLGNIAKATTSKNNVTTLEVQSKEGHQFEPPTPTYSYSQQSSNLPPESPSMESENSFNSEYSFQREPVSLQLATHHEEIETMSPKKDSLPEPNEQIEELNTAVKSPQPELVLSVDKPDFKASDDEDDDDDYNWGYNSQSSSNDEKEALNVPGENSASDIDSFIDNLNKVYSGDPSAEVLPPIDHDLSLPDFENTSFSKYEDDDEDNYSPIKPLAVSQQKEAHDDYLSSFSGRTQSIRKPPRHSAIFTDDFSGIPNDETEKATEEEKDDSITEDSVPAIAQTNESEFEQKALGNNNTELAPPELHPVASSGSLSTGKLSLDTASQKQQEAQEEESITKDIKDSRRISTSSNATFNLGGWAPNTDNFRNQFISENDNESVNFNTDRSGYDKFTKVRTESSLEEENVNASLPSIPETIDAVMPIIQEDGGSEEEGEGDDDQEKDDVQDYNGDSQSVLPTITMTSKSDSVLNEHFYPKPLFKEERLTPAASKENLLPQKYNSLLPPENRRASDSSEVSERQRSESTSTVTTNSTVQVTPKELVPGKYPVSDWKSIVTISQPIDRIAAFKDALHKEQQYDSKLTSWLHYALKRSPNTSTNLSIGRVASQAYQNAEHNDLRRHASFRSRVNIVKDKVEGTGSFGKKLFSRSKKFIKSTTGDK
ncbi:unnamed protein product [Candida dubliniensis CD36]|uniref:Protein FYV8 n=1 Tax=Candida dubliniensis (strain CD36 / ATCC MYA-646 / CBS 7987 / NCPF 3949 / NRRL Y-17841) TaxID=573826 RepID=B9WFF7_CANDC|nr:uncharacterized protein CD36_40890 [Candida dubliniensis CD36]CAX41976.1 unnamed protein product [Candida dubliniensis CD36]